MSVTEIGIRVNRLPDSEPLVHTRLTNYISLLPSFSQFLQQISTEQSSHSQKLSNLIGNYRKQSNSLARERGGDAESGESSFELGLSRVLEQMDLGVRELGMSSELQGKQVAQVMGGVGTRLDSVRKKVRNLFYD
jgi:hypothetical protein